MNQISPPTLSSSMPYYHELNGTQFEKMCRELLEFDASLYGNNGQQDYGVDIIERLPENKINVYQCKCYKNFTLTDFIKTVDELLTHWDSHWKNQNIKIFTIFVACDVSDTKIQDKYSEYRDDFLQNKRIEFKIEGQSQITDRLRENPDIIKRYLDENWVSNLCGSNLSQMYHNIPPSKNANTITPAHEKFIDSTIKKDLKRIQKELVKGQYQTALNQIEEKIFGEETIFNGLTNNVKAQAYRLKINILLHDFPINVPRLTELLDIAKQLEDNVKHKLLDAIITLHEDGQEAAISKLATIDTTMAKFLIAKLLISQNQFEEAENILQPLQNTEEEKDEILFTSALLYLAQGNASKSLQTIKKIAQKTKENNFNINRLHAEALFYSAVSILDNGDVLITAPMPFPLELVKTDDDSQANLQQAYDIFRQILETEEGQNSQLYFEICALACICCIPNKREEAKQYIDTLLQEEKAHPAIVAWGAERKLITSAQAIETLEIAVPDYNMGYPLLYSLYQENNLQDKASQFFAQYKDKIDLLPDNIKAINQITTKGDKVTQEDLERLEILADNLDKNDKEAFILICQFLLSKNHASYIYKNKDKLLKISTTARMVEMIAEAYLKIEKYQALQEFTHHHQNLFPNNQYSLYIKRMIATALHCSGDIKSIADFKNIAYETKQPIDIMNAIGANWLFGNRAGAVDLLYEYEDRIDEFSIEEKLNAINLARETGEDEIAKRFLKTIDTNNIPEDAIGATYLIHMLLEKEPPESLSHQFHEQASQNKIKGVQFVPVENIPSFMKQESEQFDKHIERYKAGLLVIHSIFNYFIDTLFTNHQNTSNKQPLMIRHGERPIYSDDDYQKLPPNQWRIRADITSIILAWDIGLLPTIEKYFAPIYLPHSFMIALLSLNNPQTHQQLKDLQAHITRGLRNKTYQRLPKLPDEQQQQNDSQLIQLLHELLSFTKDGTDKQTIIWLDDRCLSAKNNIVSRLPFGTYDILKALKHDGKITSEQYFSYLLKLREKECYFIPLEADELTYHLKKMLIKDGVPQETEELITLYRYFAKCFAEDSYLQCTEQEEKQPIEIKFTVQYQQAIRKAIANIFDDDTDTKEDKNIHASWVYHNLFYWQYPILKRHLDRDRMLFMHIFFIESEDEDYKEWLRNNLINHFMCAYPALKDDVYNMFHDSCNKMLDKTALKSFDMPRDDKIKYVYDIYINKSGIAADMIAELELKSWYRKLFNKIMIESSLIKIADFQFSYKTSYEAFAEAFKNSKKLSITSIDGVTFDIDAKDAGLIILHNAEKNLNIEYFHFTNSILLPSVKKRKASLEKNKHLLDMPNKDRDKIFDKIAKIPDIYERGFQLETCFYNNCSATYAILKEKNKAGTVVIKDLLPPSAEAMQNYMRIENVGIAPDLQAMASNLATELGVEETLNRLTGLPISLTEMFDSISLAMSSDEKNSILNQWGNTQLTPLKFFHILALDKHYQFSHHTEETKQNYVEARLTSDVNLLKYAELFMALLQYTQAMFEKMQGFQDWHPDCRMIAVWIHTQQIMGIYNKFADSNDVNQFISVLQYNTKMPLERMFGVPNETPHLLDSNFLNTERFMLLGLNYALAEQHSLLTETSINVIRDFVIETESQDDIQIKTNFLKTYRFPAKQNSFLATPIEDAFRNLHQTDIADIYKNTKQHVGNHQDALERVQQYDVTIIQNDPCRAVIELSFLLEAIVVTNDEIINIFKQQCHQLIDNINIEQLTAEARERFIHPFFNLILCYFYKTHRSGDDEKVLKALFNKMLDKFPDNLHWVYSVIFNVSTNYPLTKDEDRLFADLLTKIRRII